MRPFKKSDADAVFAMRKDPAIMRFIREPQTSISESQKWIEMISSLIHKNGIGFCAVFEKVTGQFVGWCGLWILKETKEIELGYAIRKDRWGMGYASEAAKRILEYGFDDLNLDRIVAVAYPENLSSINVMKKIGMSCVGIGRFYDQDLVQYQIKKSEFGSQESGELKI